MQKRFLLSLSILAYPLICASPTFAGTSSPMPAPEKPMVNLSEQDMEKILKDGEAELKKVKIVHQHLERMNHIEKTQERYQEGVKLYREKRLKLAKEILGNVEDSVADYKSTDIVLKDIDQKTLEKLRRRVRRIKRLENPQRVIALTEEAESLENQAEHLRGIVNTSALRSRIIKLKRVMEELKRERMSLTPEMKQEIYLQIQLDRIEDEAENFDKEVYRLTQANDYQGAKKKYDEFRKAMAVDLEKVRENMAGVRSF